MRQPFFRFGFAPPIGFWFRSACRFPRRDEYLKMLEGYSDELAEELGDVNKEIQELRASTSEKD